MSSSPTPEQNLRQLLQGTGYRGTFESHITVETTSDSDRQRFRQVCQELGVRCVLIELPAGVSRSQPMTAAYHRGDVLAVVEAIENLCQGLRAAGFSLARVKLEAVATNEGLPESDEEAAHFPPGNYFECHVKLLLPAEADLEALRRCCASHEARLSRNALKQHSDGRAERFVTLRMHGVGRRTAFARLQALEQALAEAGFTALARQREYSIFDSAESLDAGWLDRPRTDA